jgi:UDP:flavonoid glycosyltransferase YjiC (YdhE family)
MATIALIWELGSDYGHIGRLLPIAISLRESGHRPVMILRDVSRAEEMLGPYGLEYLQAPLWLPLAHGLPPALNFTESLFLFGYLNPKGLLSVARSWRALFALLKPDLLVIDHAPTALLASRELGVPRLIAGNSFSVPPRVSPLPRFRWWDKKSEPAREQDTERQLLSNANEVLNALGCPPMVQVSDIYEADATLVTGVPELDVYGARSEVKYIGAINSIEHGVSPRWPACGTTKIFAYLKPHYANFEAILTALSRLQASVIVFSPSLVRATEKRFVSANLAFSREPLRMKEVREQCDLAVCHAGGTVDVMLNAGKPVVLFPMQMEQTMTSRRVELAGCGVWMDQGKSLAEIERVFRKAILSQELAENARAYAERNSVFNQKRSMAILAETCERLMLNKASEVPLLA